MSRSFLTKTSRSGEMNFLFIEEVQEIEQFEKARRSLLVTGNMDIWYTGNNSSGIREPLADQGQLSKIRCNDG